MVDLEDDPKVPSVVDLLWPTLTAVRSIGHSGTIEEIDEQVIAQQSFTEAQQSVLHNDGPRSEIEYRLAWARTYLKGMGLFENSSRGVWSTTEEGRAATEDDIKTRLVEYRTRLRSERRARREAAAEDDAPADAEDTEDWKSKLVAHMLELSPEAFERLAQRLIREAGFINTRTTPAGGDGGIDGVGVYRLSLVSFPVYFQCKRYRGSVGADRVRDFRGAMQGRGDRGLLITTGTFTTEAKREATRAGAQPLDLIDGERLCDLLKEYRLGVRTTVEQVERIEIQPEFFDDL